MPNRFRVGFHLGNGGKGPDPASSNLIAQAKPQMLLAMQNVKPENIQAWAEQTPDALLVLRTYFSGDAVPPSANGVNKWLPEAKKQLDHFLAAPIFQTLAQAGRIGAQIFNEPNLDVEGWGEPMTAMKKYNELFPLAAQAIKQAYPQIKIVGYALTPGNRDVYFTNDPQNAQYWLHGPEAAKDNPSPAEITAARNSCLTRDAQALMDWFSIHCYPNPGTWDKFWMGTRFTRYWWFLPDRLKQNTFITEAGIWERDLQNNAVSQDTRASELTQWLTLLQKPDYAGVRGATLWWLRPGDGTWEWHFHTEPNGTLRPAANAVIQFNAQGTQPPAQDLRKELLDEAAKQQKIQFNIFAALQKKIFADGFVPNSPEFPLAFGGTDYTAQRAEHLKTGEVRVYYCVNGQWNNVLQVVRPNPLPALGTLERALLDEAQNKQAIQFNINAALQKVIFADGFVPNSAEFSITVNNVNYTAQRVEHLQSGEVRVYYCVTGQWNDVKKVVR